VTESTRRPTAARTPDAVDRAVGARLRARRRDLGLTLAALAERIGVTGHQLRKYETGRNRIGASMLFKLSRVLSMPVGSFFDEVRPAADGEAE
jgi:transcriptional regulator with XRE-family HTH domain